MDDDQSTDQLTPEQNDERIRVWHTRIPEGKDKAHQVRRHSDARLEAPARGGGHEMFCFVCKYNLMMCKCKGLGNADKLPFLRDLKPQPNGMTHADHWFRFASILTRMYTASCHVDLPRWFRDWGGLLAAALKMNKEALLQAAAAFANNLNLSSLDRDAQRDLARSLEILDIIKIDYTSKAALGRFTLEAVWKFVCGNLSQMCRFELWLSMKVVQASAIPKAHQELLVQLLGSLNSLVYVNISQFPILAPDFSKQPNNYESSPKNVGCSIM